MAGMTAKQFVFAQEYLIDLNATQAAIRAGYSSKYANTHASKLLQNTTIRTYVDKQMAACSRRTGVSADRVVRELARLAFLDPTTLMNMKDATIKEGTSEDDRAAIASVKVKSGADFTEREVKFADKLKALELLGKHLGMYTDNVNLTAIIPKIIDDVGKGEDSA